MGFFKSKELECTCLRCEMVWYTTKKEIREAKQLKRDIKMAKLDNTWKIHTVSTHKNNTTKIAVMQSAYVDPLRCPNCGSSEVEYE